MSQVLPLSRVRLSDAPLAGRKAAVLGELRAADFPVPDGFVLTTEALAGVLEKAGLLGQPGTGPVDRSTVATVLSTVEIPGELVAQLETALAGLGGGPVAVRSSGTAEDLADRSFAGQYESVLDVVGLPALLAAVRTCWVSSFSERLARYAGSAGGLAVLVQVMVPADAAGVAFSVNPVTGDAETVVSAVPGLGDRLMSGQTSAQEWTYRDGTARRADNDSPDVLTTEQVADVAALTDRVAGYFGVPQDIEWAIASGTLCLVQARPVTSTPQIPMEVVVPPGFWARDHNSDRPWTAMKSAVFLDVYRDAAASVFAFTTVAAPQVQQIAGWPYVGLPEDTTRGLATRAERIAQRLAEGEPRSLVDRWHEHWRPAFAARIEQLREVPRAELSTRQLVAHLREVLTAFRDLHRVYFQLAGAAIAIFGQLGVTCGSLLGWSAPQVLRLGGGLAGVHMGAATGIGELAALAAGRPAVRAHLTSGRPASTLSTVDAEFAAAFDAYVREHAHRTVGFELTEPTLAEHPETLLALVAAQLDAPYDFAAERAAIQGRRSAALAEARQALAGRPAEQRAQFEKAVADSSVAAPVRDEKVYYAVSLWALLRYACLELGARLDRFADPSDVFFLTLDEALAAVDGGPAAGGVAALVRRRKGEYAWALAHPGPPTYGQYPGGPQPDPEVTLSPAALRVVAIGRWSMAVSGGQGATESTQDGVLLRGVAASPGRYTGPVRVVAGVAEFGKLRRGDVLVCPETTAQWAMLFPSVGALVTDRGSLLSHPAIIAREYGVPAVVATGAGTGTLRDGQLVTVDGSAGVVRPAPGRV
ncbi:MAG: hypothetical protein J2P15_00060 [Micromonosporaceae bacterium]|nr:hypothetical protein [Micromonosporaceae bacterium]